MKNIYRWLRLSFGLMASGAAWAEPDAKAFLLKADTLAVQADQSVIASGHAALVTKVGLRFTAERIVYDRARGSVQLSGGVTIQVADGSTISAKELTIEVKEQRVFVLSGGRLQISSPSLSSAAEETTLEFSREFPRTELALPPPEAGR